MIVSILLIISVIIMMFALKVNIFHPIGIFCTMWLFFICGAMVLFQGKYSFSYAGVQWILLSCCLLLLATTCMRGRFAVIKNRNVSVEVPKIHWKLLVFIIVLGFLSVLYSMLEQGISFRVFFHFSELQRVSHEISVERYTSGSSISMISQILSTFIYATPICAGYSYIYAKSKKEKWICYLSVVPTLLNMLLTSAKLALVAYVILFFIGYYVSYIYAKKHFPKLNTRIVLSIIGGFIVLMSLFYLSFVLRIGKGEQNLFQVIIDKLSIYAFGHVQGFDKWFTKNAWSVSNYGLGSNTFLAVFSRLGLAEKKQGVYGYIDGSCTNVYTQFRGLIEDFGVVFGMLLVVLLGCICCWLGRYLMRCQKAHILMQTIFTAILFYLLYFIVSSWVYTTYFILFFIFAGYLFVSYRAK